MPFRLAPAFSKQACVCPGTCFLFEQMRRVHDWRTASFEPETCDEQDRELRAAYLDHVYAQLRALERGEPIPFETLELDDQAA